MVHKSQENFENRLPRTIGGPSAGHPFFFFPLGASKCEVPKGRTSTRPHRLKPGKLTGNAFVLQEEFITFFLKIGNQQSFTY